MLENTILVRFFRGEMERFEAAAGDTEELAGRDVANVFCAEQIERTGFRGYHPCVAQLAEA